MCVCLVYNYVYLFAVLPDEVLQGRGWWSCDLLLISCDYRGYAWQHTQSRTLCQLPETLHGVPEGVFIPPLHRVTISLLESTKSDACCVRVSSVLPTTHPANCVYREEAIKVRLCGGGHQQG